MKNDDVQRLGIVGQGALGQALVRVFVESGLDVRAWARSSAGLERAQALGVPAGTALQELADRDVLLVCVSDGAIADVAKRCAAAGLAPRVALHTSGATPPGALFPLATVGSAVGFWHPLAPLAPLGRFEPGTPIGIGGDTRARLVGERLAAVAHGRVVRLKDGAQARYHAAAALAAGGTVALFEVARALLADALLDPAGATEVVRALVGGAAQNLERLPPEGALTGPFARGDVGTLEAHLEALGAGDDAALRARKVLAALAPVLVDLAAARAHDPADLRARCASVLAELERRSGA
jgi:predicted short-subunit dehydrogenase-like oxidoreductase (DUF2520 family)